MKKTRQLVLSNKIFSIKDLQKIATVFEKQANLSGRAKRHFTVSYRVDFSDRTSVESDNSEVLSEDVIHAPSRPISITFRFHDLKLNRDLSFSISHGDYEYGNFFTIKSEENAWLSENFLAVKELIDAVEPQTFWFKNHPTITLNLIALGLGTAYQTAINIALDFLMADKIIPIISSVSISKDTIHFFRPFLFAYIWFWHLILGYLWGAFSVRRWLFNLWPNIEFSFGKQHLLLEKQRRARLISVMTLIILPVLLALIPQMFGL